MKKLGTIALLFLLVSDTGHSCQVTEPSAPAQPPAKTGPKVGHPPIPIYQPQAEMSPEARQKRRSGICVISMVVDTKGYPQNAEVIRCSDSVFAPNSLAAVAKYRFKPAVDQNGDPVPYKLLDEINFQFETDGGRAPKFLIKYAIMSPPGVTSLAPDAKGVYPLTKAMDAPIMTEFSDDGFGNAAIFFDAGVACDVALTIDRKGKPSDPQVTHCDKAILATPAVSSLLKSRYKPGRVSGQAVPVRVSIHLAYAGFAPKQ